MQTPGGIVLTPLQERLQKHCNLPCPPSLRRYAACGFLSRGAPGVELVCDPFAAPGELRCVTVRSDHRIGSSVDTWRLSADLASGLLLLGGRDRHERHYLLQ